MTNQHSHVTNNASASPTTTNLPPPHSTTRPPTSRLPPSPPLTTNKQTVPITLLFGPQVSLHCVFLLFLTYSFFIRLYLCILCTSKPRRGDTNTIPAPHTTAASNCSRGGNGCDFKTANGNAATKRGPRDVDDVSWAVGRFFFLFLFYPIPPPRATARGVGTGATSTRQTATPLPNEAQETSMTSLVLLVGFFFRSYFTNKSFYIPDSNDDDGRAGGNNDQGGRPGGNEDEGGRG